MAEIEALGDVTAQPPQELEDRAMLHALGDDPKTQVVTQFDDGPHDTGVAGIVGHALHEALVDLHLINGKFLQIGQRRIARY
jgi:hypothetical protein